MSNLTAIYGRKILDLRRLEIQEKKRVQKIVL